MAVRAGCCCSTYFYPRPPRGGRRPAPARPRRTAQFLSTPSARRATFLRIHSHTVMIYFYPRPPRGGRHGGTNPPPATYRFLSTPSARRATADDVAPGAGLIEISIHALREEGDTMSCGTSTSWPRFLSTPSARRATSGVCAVPVNLLFLSTPSARRATLVQPSAQPRVHISIHALREEGDFQLVRGFNSQHKFLSTPSARRATRLPLRHKGEQIYFYPRPPRGGRQ